MFGLGCAVCRLRSPDRNHARFQTAPTGNARSGSGSPSVGCDRQIATMRGFKPRLRETPVRDWVPHL